MYAQYTALVVQVGDLHVKMSKSRQSPEKNESHASSGTQLRLIISWEVAESFEGRCMMSSYPLSPGLGLEDHFALKKYIFVPTWLRINSHSTVPVLLSLVLSLPLLVRYGIS